MTWYKTGTVAVTPGSNAVLGTGTSFIANARVGDAFRGPDGEWYEVTNIASDTALSIAPDYQGAAVTAGAYSLAPMQGYVKDSADALRAATQVIASGVADMQEQVAAATEAAQSAGQSKTVATEQAGIATASAQVSTDSKDAAQLAAQQSQGSAQASGAAAERSETARDSIVESEQAAAASAAAAAESAEQAEAVTVGKAASGDNNDINSLRALTPGGFERLRLGISVMVGATANIAGVKGLAPAATAGDQDKFLTGGGVYKEVGGGLPVGAIEPWGISRSTLPAGWIPRDGQELDRATWPDLWALVSVNAITDASWLAAPYEQRGKYSSGNGTTTFRMPDDNGKHPDGNTYASVGLRGDGKNSTGTIGQHQKDQLQDFRLTSETYRSPDRATAARYIQLQPATVFNVGGVASSNSENYLFNSPSALSGYAYVVPSAAKIGTETHGPSTTVIWCTVGAGKAVNTGSVDVTALATSVGENASRISVLEGNQVVSKKWVSADTAWTNGGTINLTHTMGRPWTNAVLWLKYKVAVNGMAIGEKSLIASNSTTVAGAGNFGIEIRKPTSTTATLQVASNGIYSTGTTGGTVAVTPAQADLVVELWS